MMEQYTSKREYLQALENLSHLPEGFFCSTTSLTFFSKEMSVKKPYNMNLALLALIQDTESFAAVFTRNCFPGAPILINKERLSQNSLRGVLINNKVANVSTTDGKKDAEQLLEILAQEMGTSASQFFCASTGVIGWKLPVDEMGNKISQLVSYLKNDSILPVAEAIMTTDAYPKVREQRVGLGKILGIAKGAGMIEPNMATMLVFILTDIHVQKQVLQESINWAAVNSFNRISIDGDQSTSDMALLFSSNKIPLTNIDDFNQALLYVCQQLAEDIVRNGEGVKHVIKVQVVNAPSLELALGTGKAIINSPLVKTAIFGNDPNVGRIVSALGDFLGNTNTVVNTAAISISLGGINIFSNNSFYLDMHKERKLSNYLKDCSFSIEKGYPPHDKNVEITVNMAQGREKVEVIGTDLSYDYIKENAEYRS